MKNLIASILIACALLTSVPSANAVKIKVGGRGPTVNVQSYNNSYGLPEKQTTISVTGGESFIWRTSESVRYNGPCKETWFVLYKVPTIMGIPLPFLAELVRETMIKVEGC